MAGTRLPSATYLCMQGTAEQTPFNLICLLDSFFLCASCSEQLMLGTGNKFHAIANTVHSPEHFQMDTVLSGMHNAAFLIS